MSPKRTIKSKQKSNEKNKTMRNFYIRDDSPPQRTQYYHIGDNITAHKGNLDWNYIEFEGEFKFKNPSSSKKRKINKKTEEQAAVAREKLGVDKNLIPFNFNLHPWRFKTTPFFIKW